MTAIRSRRKRSTVLALVAAIAGIGAAAVLGVAGVHTLADSTAGRQVEGQAAPVPTQRLPYTPTALVGTVDEDGRLTSSVAIALEPDGTGGSIIAVAASADAGSGTADRLAPIDALLAVDGPVGYLEGVERLTGLSFDVVELVDQTRLAQLITPLGDLPATFPVDLTDASSGDTWTAGELTLTSPGAARAVTAADPTIEDWYLEPARSAVWRAIADRVGAGIGSAEPVAPDEELAAPATLDEFLERLFAGPVAFRALGFVVIDDERVGDQLPAELAAVSAGDAVGVVAHDRAELLMVFGSIAPARLGAPLDAPSFRVVSGFTDEDLRELGLNRADVLKQAIDRLLFVKVNIVSVADLPAAAVPEQTEMLVADPDVVDGVIETYGDLFGGVEVRAADVVVEGVEIEVRLGRSFLAELRGESGADVAGSGS